MAALLEGRQIPASSRAEFPLKRLSYFSGPALFGLHGPETGLDVAQALAVRQLGEGQAKERVETREAAHLVLAVVARDAGAKLRQREEVHHLRKHRSTGMHGPLLR